MEKLKARAYDLLVMIQNAQRELEKVNNEIAKLSQVKEEPKISETKTEG